MNRQLYWGLVITLSTLTTVNLPAVTRANPIDTTQQISSVTINNYLEIGKEEYTAQHYEKALVAFQQVINVNNTSAEGYYWRGKTLVELGETKLAIADFKTATCRAADEGNIAIYNQSLKNYQELTH